VIPVNIITTIICLSGNIKCEIEKYILNPQTHRSGHTYHLLMCLWMICKIMYYDVGFPKRGVIGRYTFDIMAVISILWLLAEALGNQRIDQMTELQLMLVVAD
jgi:predicted membrane protein